MLTTTRDPEAFDTGLPPFARQLWDDIAPIRAAISRLDLLTQLQDGTLAPEVFRHYIQQDALYLKAYARSLAIVAAKAETSEEMANFLTSSQTALAVEGQLHSGFLTQFGVSSADLHAAEASPSALAYISYVSAVVRDGSYAVGLSAILPCFWIYADVGAAIKARPAVPGNVYQPWIDTYGDADFAEATRTVIALTDKAALAGSEAERRRMREVFRKASQYEWMFWQSASELEDWRV